ncbi:hypothetical protein ACORG1_15350 [Mycobacterium sp. TJFP1]
MTELGGGGVAAFGFSYQYLQTAEVFLTFLRDNTEQIPRATLVVEPLHTKADGEDDDVVDFAIEVDGDVLYSIQVKSSVEPDQNPMQPAPARTALERLVAYPAANTLLLTNKPISPGLLDEVEIVPGNGAETTTAYTWANGPQRGPNDPGAQPNIVVDSRRPVVIRNSIAELIRFFRGQRALRQGVVSARLLVPILQDYIFSAAAGQQPSRLSALDLLEILAMPDPRIAHVAGGFDWGVPITGIPNYLSTVPRFEYLEQVQEHLAPDDTTITPARVVLTGRTGNGKTVLATDYCHVESISYEFICWIDCREVDFIEPQIRNLISQLTSEQITADAAVASVFAGMLGRHSGPWLLVFDGVQNRSDIDAYIPSMGNGSVLVTSNNSLNWWPSVPVIDVGEMTEVEAVHCFASYAGIADADIEDVRSPISEIVDRLGLVPLAVSMSAIYFKNTEGQLDELALQYFSDLEALADSDSRPPGFPRTAFAAIQHAVRNLGKGTPAGATYGRSARAVLEIGSLLAPELLPLNFMLLATPEELQINLANLPVPTEVDKVTLRGVLSTLRTQTIARRVVNDGDGSHTAVSDTIAIHPLVHDILQRSYLAAVPPGYLEPQCTVFMYFLIGWLGQMRTEGEYFAVEQLRLHANALLALVAENEPMSSLSADNTRVYTYAKTLLQAELSTCAASRGRLQVAFELGTSAFQTLSRYMHEPYARRIAMKILANMIADLSMGEAPSEAIRRCAIPFVSSVAEAEADTSDSVRALAYTLASDTLAVINRLDTYRDAPELTAIRQRLFEVTQRDPSLATQEATQMMRVNELYEAGHFTELLYLADELLAANTSLEGRVILKAIKITALLLTNAVDEALAGVDELLELRNYADYVLLSLHEALKKIGRELYRMIDTEAFSSTRPRLQRTLDRVVERYNELSDSAGPESSSQTEQN